MPEERTTIDHEAAPATPEKGELRRTIVKLVIASLIVGVVMKWIGFTPVDLLRFLGDSMREIFENLGTFASTLAEWLLLGATIVVPVWLVMRLLGGKRRQ